MTAKLQSFLSVLVFIVLMVLGVMTLFSLISPDLKHGASDQQSENLSDSSLIQQTDDATIAAMPAA